MSKADLKQKVGESNEAYRKRIDVLYEAYLKRHPEEREAPKVSFQQPQ